MNIRHILIWKLFYNSTCWTITDTSTPGHQVSEQVLLLRWRMFECLRTCREQWLQRPRRPGMRGQRWSMINYACVHSFFLVICNCDNENNSKEQNWLQGDSSRGGAQGKQSSEASKLKITCTACFHLCTFKIGCFWVDPQSEGRSNWLIDALWCFRNWSSFGKLEMRIAPSHPTRLCSFIPQRQWKA